MKVADLHGVADRTIPPLGLKIEKTPAGLALRDKQGKTVGTATAQPLKFDPEMSLPLRDRATPDDLRLWAAKAAGAPPVRAFGRREQ